MPTTNTAPSLMTSGSRSVLATLLVCCALAHAEPVAAPVRAEIDALLARLQASACQFNRNGSWHSAADARTHLLRKLDYLEGKNLVRSTEQFIEQGASKSSSSGKPYLVRCGQAAVLESGPWLTAELKSIRTAARAVAAPSANR